MPSRSEKQRRALYAKKGEKWVRQHHFDKVVPKKSAGKKRGKRG